MKLSAPVRNLCVCGIIVFAATWLLYAHTLKFDFIWDDFGSIVHNQALSDWSSALQSFWKCPTMPGSQYDPSQLETQNYRPLRTLFHAAIFQAVGAKASWFHLANITGHATVALLLFLMLFYLLRSCAGAMTGALFFALHPVLTEPVCWAKSLEDMLAAILVLSSFICFEAAGKYSGKMRFGFYSGSMLFYILAMTAKMSVVFLPVFLLLRFLLQVKTESGRTPGKLPFILLMGGLTAAGLFIQHLVLGHTAQGGFITGDCWTTWLSMPRILVRYLFIEFIPVGMLADYETYPRAITLTDPTAWLYAAVLLTILIGISRLLYRNNMWQGWLWFWCALLPFTNLIPMVQLGADRFLYLATIGIAWLVADLCRRFMISRVQYLAVALLLLAFALLSWQRSQVWKNELALWNATVKQTPTALRPRENLVKAQLAAGEFGEALNNAEYLARRSPKSAHQVLYGYVLCCSGDYRKGIMILTMHRADNVLNIVAVNAIRQGRKEIARECLNAARKINPGDPRYQHNLELLNRQK